MRRIPAWLRGGAMLAAAAMAWGGMFPVVKPLMHSIDPFGLTLVRYGLAAPVFLALLWAAEGRHAFATEGQALRLWWSGTLGFAGFGLFAFVGLESTRPEHAAVIPALLPLISVVVISARQQAWPSARAILAIAVGLGGVALVVTHGDPWALLTGGAGRGEALVLAGATCWVFYTLGAAAFPGWSGLRYTAMTCVLGLVSIAGAEALALASGLAALPRADALAAAVPSLGYMVVVASVLAVLGWNGGIREIGAARGVLFINLVPVTAFAIAVVGGRVPEAAELAGVALVVAALLLNSLSPAHRVAPPSLPVLQGRS